MNADDDSIDNQNGSATADNTCAQWSCHSGETRDSKSSSRQKMQKPPRRKMTGRDRKPQSGRSTTPRRDKRCAIPPDKRRHRLPKSYSGRVFQYDSQIVVQPVEINLHTRNWNNVPRNQRHTRNYYLRYLNCGVRGSDVFSHDKLKHYLKDKKEIL